MLCMAGQGEEKTRSAMVTTTGYWYADAPNNNPQIHQIHQSFDPNPEIYNLSTGMEMIGWKSFFNKAAAAAAACGGGGGGGGGLGPSSSKTGLSGEPSTSHEFYHQDFSTAGEAMMGGAPPGGGGAGGGAWVEDDPSLRCVFPCEGNERPSQGLSLSLSSSNPSAIGLQSFELRHHESDLSAPMMHDGFLGKAAANLSHPSETTGYFQIRNSKYLGPAQELLNEFCCLGTSADINHHSAKMKLQKTSQWQDNESSASASSSKKPPLGSLDLLELQKRKTKLLQMLEEVDRRYKHYCDQMKAVVSSFEAVAGNGAATVYSALASKAMSRHFRCLKDGIVAQIKAIQKATSEKDTVAPGTTKGETPRLRVLDQALRQQRAFQQMTMMENHPWRPQRGLPERSVSVLRAWLFEHFLHPYPSDVDKHILARQTGLSRSQVSNWFINARVRLWKPMVEEMYVEETKEQENLVATSDDNVEAAGRNHQIPRNDNTEDQKPNVVRIDSECISSIINNHPAAADDKNVNAGDQPRGGGEDDHHHHHHHLHHQQAAAFQIFGARGGGGDHQFGRVAMDFSSYNHNSAGAAFSYAAVGGTGGKTAAAAAGVSLTLGLQQQGGSGGMGLAAAAAFSSAPSQSSSSLFYPRDQMEDCQTVPYSLLDSEGQNLPYRNLMGAQLLHDLAG